MGRRRSPRSPRAPRYNHFFRPNRENHRVSARRKKDDDRKLDFETALERLENIVRELEEGQLGLSAALDRYEEGVKYFKQCHHALQQAERRIELLTRVDDEGQAVSEPFHEEEMSLPEKQEARARRRSQPSGGSDEPDVDTQKGLF